MTLRLLVLIAGTAVISGCGGDDTPGTASTTTPTVNALTIAGNDAIRTGFFTNYTATVQLSNGTTQVVTPTWSSSNPSVGSVDSAGRLDGVAHGSINLAASYQGRSASKNVNVVHNYGGNWTGTYVIKACDQSGIFADLEWCEFGGVGNSFQYSLALTQSGNDLNEVRGSITFFDLPANVSGNVTGDGRLVVEGTSSVTIPEAKDVTFEIKVGGWNTRPAAGDSMSGGWAMSLRALNVPGNAYEEHSIVSATHTSQQITVSAAPDRYVLTLAELFQRLGRRGTR